MYEIIRHCPSCEGDFRHDIESCPDCEVELVTVERTEDPGHTPGRPRLALSPGEMAVPVRDAELQWITELAARLTIAGIPTGIEPTPERCGSFRVVVRERDRNRAATIDAAYFAEQVPAAPQIAEPAEFDRCPSCDTSLSESATECPECGLSFPEVQLEPAGDED